MDMMLGDGPMISGHWYNPKTGDSFTVRDTFFEDNNIIVMTTDGRRLDYDIISKYVKTEKPMPKQKPAAQKQEIPQSVLSQVLPVEKPGTTQTQKVETAYEDLLTAEDKAMLGVTVDPGVLEIKPATQKVAPVVVEDEDNMLVRRILKRATEPSVDCRIVWKNFPFKQFEMLEMMAVDPEKIADYYLSKVDIASLKEIVKKGIVDYIDKQLTPQEVKTVVPESKTEPIHTANGCTCVDSEGVKYLEQNGEVLVNKLEKVTPKKKTTTAKKKTTRKK